MATQSLSQQLRTKRSEMMVSELEAVALRLFEERGLEPVPYSRTPQKQSASGRKRVPICASVTFIQAGSNRGVTGQTLAVDGGNVNT